MMDEVSISETSVNFFHTTGRNIPKVSQLQTRRRENLKYHHLFGLSFELRLISRPLISIKTYEYHLALTQHLIT
jgi:hypothetical protein